MKRKSARPKAARPTMDVIPASEATTGTLREFIWNLSQRVVNGQVNIREAAVAVKACEVINQSVYSETKIASLEVAAGRKAAALGALLIGQPRAPVVDIEGERVSSGAKRQRTA